MLRAAFFCLFLATAAVAEEPQLVEGGKLTWGSSPTFAPFEFMRDGKPVGFDVDLMEQLAGRLALSPNMMGMEFKGVIPALLGHRIDLGVSGLYITPEARKSPTSLPT